MDARSRLRHTLLASAADMRWAPMTTLCAPPARMGRWACDMWWRPSASAIHPRLFTSIGSPSAAAAQDAEPAWHGKPQRLTAAGPGGTSGEVGGRTVLQRAVGCVVEQGCGVGGLPAVPSTATSLAWRTHRLVDDRDDGIGRAVLRHAPFGGAALSAGLGSLGVAPLAAPPVPPTAIPFLPLLLCAADPMAALSCRCRCRWERWGGRCTLCAARRCSLPLSSPATAWRRWC